MTEKETREKMKEKERPSKIAFIAWFISEFWTVSGKFVLPTVEELKEIASEVYQKLN